MKRIRMLCESTRGLGEYLDCVEHGAEWQDFRSHDAGNSYGELLNEMIDLQHGLCGYCEIDLTELDRQVEHVVPRSAPNGASRSLDVTNMIACCKGGTAGVYGNTRKRDETRYREPVRHNQSCGQKKGDRVYKNLIDPRTLPALPSLIRVLLDGTMKADAKACECVGESADRVERTIEILGLNVRRLRDARERRWRTLNDTWKDYVDDPDMMGEVARGELLPKNGRLPRFFTTNRSYFGSVGERILAEHPQVWI